MDIMTSPDMIEIIRRTLNRVDSRLVDHGERVAYIIYKMGQCANAIGADVSKIIFAAILHDLGAYKTEEIDRMAEFESSYVWEHSVYGYLFLNNLSPLSEYAHAVLYHHFPYDRFGEVEGVHMDLAAAIKIADRADMICLATGRADIDMGYFKKNAGALFHPEIVRLFIETQNKYDIMRQIATGGFKSEFDGLVRGFELTDAEISDYLRMVAYSIDFRSEYMVLHTVTTVAVSVEIARMLGFSGDEIKRVYYGALLHDIGKVGTPVEILEKPGKLSPDEMEIMKRHVTLSAEILDGCINRDVFNMAVRHHEKLDGSGYPAGLVKADLTLGESIVAVSDIISALIRKRSYKEAFDRSKAVDILSAMSGEGKLSPYVVDAVVSDFGALMDKAESDSAAVLNLYARIKSDYVSMMRKIRGD